MKRFIPVLVVAAVLVGCGETKTKVVAVPQPSSQYDMHRTPTKQSLKLAKDSARLDGYRAQAIYIRNALKEEAARLNAIVKQIDDSQAKIDKTAPFEVKNKKKP